MHTGIAAIVINIYSAISNDIIWSTTLQPRHNGRDGVWNHQPHDSLLFIEAQIKENIKAPRHWPSCGEFIGDRLIARTNGE